MRKIYVSQLLVEVESLKEILDQADIPCTIKNQQTSMLAGEVPFAEVFPELWVIRDEDYPKAKELLDDWTNAKATGNAGWTCSGCGTQHAGEFTACWKCGKERSSDLKTTARDVSKLDERSQDKFSMFEFLVGLVLGVLLMFGGLTLWDYFSLEPIPSDRNRDGKIDAIYSYRGSVLTSAKLDDDFNGLFETVYEHNRDGVVLKGEIDRNQDGTVDLVEHFTLGKFSSQDFLDESTGKVKKRAYYKLSAKVREEIDFDGDGQFEKTIHFDEFEFPVD